MPEATTVVADPARAALEAARARHFGVLARLVLEAHPYYRSVLAQLGVPKDGITALADLRKLPVTTKRHYMADPEAFRLQVERLEGLSVPERTLWSVVYTTGSTTGRPAPFYDTGYDHAARIAQMQEACGLAGITADDVVANCFPLTAVPHQGFLSALYGPLAVGARVLTGMTGRAVTPFPVYRSTAELAQRIASSRATVIWGITSYVRRVVRVAGELRLDLSAVRLVFAAGEPCPPGMRDDLKERLAALGARQVVVQNGYGATELQGPTIQCSEGGPFHLPGAEHLLVEVLDPSTHEPLPDGRVGLVAISHLDRRGTVLWRYALGDVSALAHDTCPSCGRSGPRFQQSPERIDGLVKVRGTLVNPSVVIGSLSGLAGVDDFQLVVVDQEGGGDALVVRFTARAHEAGSLVTRIEQAVRHACEVQPQVAYVPPEEFAGLQDVYKFRRFQDERSGTDAPGATE